MAKLGMGLAASALAGLLATVGPAAARLADPTQGGIISGGYFQGLPLGPKASAAREEPRGEPSAGVVGENCYLVPARMVTANGEVTIRLTRHCE